jgi:hypothetical protein
MFAVDDIEDDLTRLRAHGAELIGEVGETTWRRFRKEPAPASSPVLV